MRSVWIRCTIPRLWHAVVSRRRLTWTGRASSIVGHGIRIILTVILMIHGVVEDIVSILEENVEERAQKERNCSDMAFDKEVLLPEQCEDVVPTRS